MDFTTFPQSLASIDGATRGLLEDVAILAGKVNGVRPLSPEQSMAVSKRLLGERVYNSNAIEGNPLTLRETVQVLQAGAVLDGGHKKAAQEALNLGKLCERIEGLVPDASAAWDEDLFLQLHSELFTDVNPAIAGHFRSAGVMIRGARHQPPDESKVRGLLASVWAQIKAEYEVHPPASPAERAVSLAAWTHWAIARVHPFLDGNGRLARLWQDLILFQHGLTVAIIRPEYRNEYDSALTSADDGDLNPVVQLVGRSVATTLQAYVNAFQEVDAVKDWAKRLVGDASEKLEKERDLEYLRWARGMESIRDAFERCAAQINQAAAGAFDVQVRPMGIFDRPTWEVVRAGCSESKAWFFWLECRRGSKRVAYCFFFGKHLWRDTGEAVHAPRPTVSLLISEQGSRDAPARLLDDDHPFDLRELIVFDGQFVCRRRHLSADGTIEDRYETSWTPIQAAQVFLQDVVQRRFA